MGSFNALLKDLAAVPDAVPVAVTIKPATAADGAILTAGLLRQFLPAADALTYTGVWACPVGEPGSASYPPAPWVRTNYLGASYKLYTLNHPEGLTQIHTGDDLNLTGTKDLNAPVRAIHEAEVIYAGDGGGTWLGVVVLKVAFDDTFVAVRYAHLTALHVQPGDQVKAGELLGLVGDPTGRAGFEPHLHFDVGKTGDSWLLDRPTDWPGTDRATILAHYQDAQAFMKSKVESVVVVPVPAGDWLVVNSAIGVNVREGPALAATKRGALPDKTKIRVNGSVVANGYHWGQITDVVEDAYALMKGGWVAREYLANPQ